MIEPNSAEGNGKKNHYSDVEESINSTHKETKTDSGIDCNQNTRESTNAVKYEGNKGRSIKPDATLHETVAPELDKENESKEKSRPKSAMDELESVEDNNGRKDYFYDVEENTGYTHEEIKIGAGSRESITEHTEDVKNKGNKRMPVEHDVSLHDNNGSKDYFSGVEESIESACKATMTTARRGPEEKSTKSTKVVQSKGNDGMLVESNARLYEPVESQPDKENAAEDNSKPKLMIVEGESPKDDANEDHFFDVSKRSMHKETKTNARRGHKENTTQSTEIIIEDTFALEVVSEREDDTAKGRAQISQSKTENVDNEILSEPAAEKRPSVEAENQKQPIIELEDKDLSSSSEEEPKDPGQKELSDATSAADNLPEKPLQGDPDQELSSSTSVKTKSNHPNSPTPEYTTMNLDDCLNQVEENPFILLDFMSRELSISSKRSESSDQISSTKENFEAALEELRELAFSQSMTKNVKDVEYREKLEAAAQKLEKFPQELNEELNGKIKSFFDLYNQACEILKEQEVTSDTISQVIAEKDADFDKLQTAKNQVKQLEDAIGECKPKIKELEKHENDLNDKIRKLQEELSGVEKDKAKLKTAQGKNIAKKTDFVASARHVSTNLGRLLKQKEELEKSQAKLDIDFEALKKRYNKMRGEPHF